MVFKKSEPVTTDSGNPIHLLSSQEQSHKRCVQTYFCSKKNFRKIGLFVYYQIRYMQLTRWTIACVTIFGCNSLCSIVCKFRWHWKKVYKWVRKLQKISRAFSNVDTIYRSWFIQTTFNKWILRSSIDQVGDIENTLFSYSQL